MKKEWGIIYSNVIKNSISKITVENIINSIKDDNIIIHWICAEEIKKSFDKIDMLINILGSYYPEEYMNKLYEFIIRGGNILSIGLKPFTIPYIYKKHKLTILDETNEFLHQMHYIDKWTSTGKVTCDMDKIVFSQKYDFLKNVKLPQMKQTSSAYYIMSKSDIQDLIDSHDIIPDVTAEIEPICGFKDKAGRLVNMPIVRLNNFTQGDLIFLNFKPEDENYYNTDDGKKLLQQLFILSSMNSLSINLKFNYPRYYENETPELKYKITYNNKWKDDLSCYIRFDLINKNTNEVVKSDIVDLVKLNIECKGFIKYFNIEEGDFILQCKVFINGKLVSDKTSGFLKYSEQNFKKQFNNYKKVYFDYELSPDFALQDGVPYSIHGANYHVSDVYRNCFVDFNPVKCEEDLIRLKNTGFNTLRTGIWRNYLKFFSEDGTIYEYSLRALEVFFLISVRYDFLVQFVLGAFVMNPWNREKSPLHNAEIYQKTINAFSSFAKRFKGYPNVQLDAINEPSYSLPGWWKTARSTGDISELYMYRKWLKEKYKGDISILRSTWGVNNYKIKSFDDIKMPVEEMFSRNFDAKPIIYPEFNYACITDFYEFARETFSNWVSDIRKAIKDEDPEMVFMMGRDESLRIPEQQYEAYKGNIAMTNWHQWHKDGFVFAEYYLNKVRGLPCCGQEIGVYHYNDLRGNARYSDNDCANILERKILYSFGNWIQWQAYCDSHMTQNCEYDLGLFRVDYTETPYLDRTRLISWVEEKTAKYLKEREEQKTKILVVHPSSHYYSAENDLAIKVMNNTIKVLHYNLKQTSNIVLEHLLLQDNNSQIGQPDLVLFPAANMMSENAWQALLNMANEGKTVCISGIPRYDCYWRETDRAKFLNIDAEYKMIKSVEKIKIDGNEFYTDFTQIVDYFVPGTVMNKTIIKNEENRIRVVQYGKGKLIISPLPLEMGNNLQALEQFYRFAIKQANIDNQIYELLDYDLKPNILLYPIFYKDCTLYTIVNEGDDDYISFKDLSSGKSIKIYVKGQRGAKLCINHNGDLIGGYINDKLYIDEMIIEPNGDLAIYNQNSKMLILPGQRESYQVIIDNKFIKIENEFCLKYI